MKKSLERVKDKRGRVFEVGAEVTGRPGVKVESISKIGNFVQVNFERAVQPVGMPGPIMMHVGDLEV